MYYSSADLPPGYTSRKAFAAACREGRVPGAHRGGRLWLVSVVDYHRGRSLTVAPSQKKKVAVDAESRALASLREQGFEPGVG
jgi:hypothetical protein